MAKLGLKLPDPSPHAELWSATIQSGQFLYVSGRLPIRDDGSVVSGCVGENMSVEEAADAARIAALRVVSEIKGHLGDLDKVSQLVRLVGIVNAEPGFVEHPRVIDGASELFLSIFGARGRHTRSVFGSSSLVRGAVVELEVTAEVIQPD